ncbi:DUF6191 domain-containing protein [Streptomyces sp. NPDC058877]|uniref:DUF6191 domain-containing protein n=1 Tax=Streptomyces sp. NPDC058877 TaxID=3346665 RepID=UPI0036B9E214
MFGGLEEFFAPGRRHTEEERRRQALTREDPGDADPARGPVDLSSGRVTIRLPRGSGGCVQEAEAVGQGGGLAPAGDAELGEDVGDVDAGGLG